MADYNPENRADRAALASALLAMFAEAGFTEADTGTIERCFERAHHRLPGARVLVYSSIFGDAVAAEGKDAIRVVGLWRGLVWRSRPEAPDEPATQGMREIPIVPKPARVFRTGTVERIAERTLERMREVYGAVGEVVYCRRKCGAPMATSKTTGRLYCAARCHAMPLAERNRRADDGRD